jgi:hypothetical protein
MGAKWAKIDRTGREMNLFYVSKIQGSATNRGCLIYSLEKYVMHSIKRVDMSKILQYQKKRKGT